LLNRHRRAQAVTESTDGRGLPLLNVGDITRPPGDAQGEPDGFVTALNVL